MRTALIYIVLLSFWLENSLHIEAEKLFGLGSGPSFQNISIFLLILGWLFAVRSQNSLYNKNNLNIFMILLGFFILTSNVVEVLYYDNFSNIRQFRVLLGQIRELKFFVSPWIFFLLLVHIIQNKNECENLFRGVIFLMFLTAATAILDQFISINLGTLKHSVAYEGRSAGFSEANEYGAFLVLILPISLSYVLSLKKLQYKFIFSILFFVGFIGLMSTVSRGAYIGFIIAATSFFVMSIKQKLIPLSRTVLVFAFLIPTLSVVTYIVLPSSVKDAFEYKVIEKADPSRHNVNPWRQKNRSFIDIYTSRRTELWAESVKQFLESPLWGKGNYTIKSVLRLKPHNDYLRILVKYGLIGFFLYIMLYINIFRKMRLSLKKVDDNYSRFIYIGYLSGFIGYMVCMFGVGLGIPRFIFWIYTAGIIKYSQLDNSISTKAKPFALSRESA